MLHPPSASRRPVLAALGAPLLAVALLLPWPGSQAQATGAQPSASVADAVAPTADSVRALLQTRRFDEADAAAQQLVAAADSAGKTPSLALAEALGLLVEAKVRRGEASKPATRELAERALAITEQLVGPDDPLTATRVSHLGHVVSRGGDPAGARPLYERALAIRERALGNDHPEVGASAGDLASVLEGLGELDAAQALYERALSIAEKSSGPDHPDVAYALVDLASLLGDRGDFARAKPMLERALSIRERALGPTHPDVAQSLNSLAVLLRHMGDYTGARQRFERALQIKEQTLGPEHPDVARYINNLANLLAESGDFAAARPLFERALAIRTKALGPDHLDVGTSTHNLASVLWQTGDYAAAKPLFERALAIWEARLGPEHPNVAICLDNLGSVAFGQGDLATARQYQERALVLKEKAFGADHPSVATTLDDLANVAFEAGDLARARSLHERALAIKEKALGPEHPEVARGLDNLASTLYASGDFAQALPLHERALAIRTKTLGPTHPDLARSYRNCAFSQLAARDTLRALQSALAAEQIGRDHLRLTSRSLGERQALSYASVRSGGLDLVLTLAAVGVGGGAGGAELRKQQWDAVVRSRAVVLDEMGARHRGAFAAQDPDVDSLTARVEATRAKLAGLTVRGMGSLDPGEYRTLLDDSTRDMEAAERALAERSAGFQAELARTRVGLEQVLQALPPRAALLAYCRFAPSELPASNGAARAAQGTTHGPRYLAFVGRRDSDGGDHISVWPLGDAATIDSLAGAWRGEAGRFAWHDQLGEQENACRRTGAALRTAIWDPVAPSLAGADLVLVVPDGALHLVNLAALPQGEHEYLVDRWLLHVLSAERDVVRADEPAGSGVLAVGDPDYDRVGDPSDTKLTELVAMLTPFRGARPGCAAFEALRFARLPQTRAEIETVDRICKRARRGERVTSLSGQRANEARVKAEMRGKRVVHLATHGFFLGDDCPTTPTGALVRRPALADEASTPLAQASFENPLLLSGLALAGSNRRQDAAPDAEDGVLTAEEVASLDLRGVEWAVLSACETATGDVRTSEGVFGLRRAFETAGAHTLIMSLWSVEDQAGRAWMEELYRARFTEGLSTAAAVRQADLRILAQRRRTQQTTHPSVWAGFIAAGDWR